ncbi:Lrguk [Symbiodinium natans]|uniref:Lrguk protein n=1 Tax=Symbiodinium natans TaxID=878477 RepID=A0A812PVQ7_9DINO|nr:Lrguk [Symbiodinium natans]
MHAGSAVVLRAAVGPAPARSVGLLGEFCLATGRWRVWLEGEGSVGVDARQQDIGLLDGGARPQRCCYTCWRLSSRLWRSADATREYCDDCRRNGDLAEDIPKDPCLRGMEDLPAGPEPSARAMARISLALAHAQRPHELLLKKFRAAAERLYQRVTEELPLQEDIGLSKPSALATSVPDIPVFVVNLDRSPHRLEDMRREARRCNLRARRFAATDGRHRVVRRSQCEPYTRDLTSFALRWDEARPAIGVALTADQERHYVGYVGSWLSHMRALRQGLEEGSPFVVVLEDDQVLSSDFNGVLQDIVESAGDLLDVIILGPLDWRLRSLQYAQRRKVMQLRHPCSGTRSKEEEFMAELYGYTPTLQQESTYFLYSIGSRAMTGEDLLSTGCCGVWGYLVSRRGCQKMEASMKFMWESFDDVLQAELQGDNRFTSFVGKHRLWAVWPPLVTSDGKWPSQNSGEDLELGRQPAPVSPHASFRDHSLQVQAAQLLLGPGQAFLAGSGIPDHRHLRVAATAALLWPPVEPVWAYVVRGWRRLFAQRAGSGGGFELRTEMQHKLYKEKRFFDLASEGLTWSWTVLRAAFLFDMALPLPALWSTTPPEGPPIQLPPLCLRVVWGPWAQLNWAPSAWWRDLLDAAPGSRVSLAQPAAQIPFTGAELRPQLPRATFYNIQVQALDTLECEGAALVLAAEVAVTMALLQALETELAAGRPVLATARSLATLAELWNALSKESEEGSLDIAFVGVNPFASQLCQPSAVGADPLPGRWARIRGLTKRPDLNGAEVLLAEEREDGRWRVSTPGGDLAVRREHLEVFVEEPWPPAPSRGLTASEWKAICASPARLDASAGGTNAFWLGIRPSRPDKRNGVSFSSFTAPYSARDSYAGMSDHQAGPARGGWDCV